MPGVPSTRKRTMRMRARATSTCKLITRLASAITLSRGRLRDFGETPHPEVFLLAELCIRLADVRLNPPGDLGTHHSSFQEPDVHRFLEQTPWTPALFCISRIVQPEPIVVQRFLLRVTAIAALWMSVVLCFCSVFQK